MARIVALTGVSGVGKSTMLRRLGQRPEFADDLFFDLDQSGIESDAGGAWRAQRAATFLDRIRAHPGLRAVLAGSFVPGDFGTAQHLLEFCLLSADQPVLRDRLRSRYESSERASELRRITGLSPEAFILAQAEAQMKFEAEVLRAPRSFRVDTSQTSEEALETRLAAWIR